MALDFKGIGGLPCLLNIVNRNPRFPQNKRESAVLGKILIVIVTIISIAIYAYPMTSRYAIAFFLIA